jgi:hypothetical protein
MVYAWEAGASDAAEAERQRILAGLALLPTVGVEYAPAHSAPYVSRDLVWSLVNGVVSSPASQETETR